MNRTARAVILVVVSLLSPAAMQADQQETTPAAASIEVDPGEVTLEVGSSAQLHTSRLTATQRSARPTP